MAMNKNITSEEVRDIFLRFFEERDHLRIPGNSLVPKDDPTLLFVNSGMAPLKQYFSGEAEPPKPNLCNVQPCIRTRDIDDVGDRHHLTFFEMLGSWSIDNYFKERSVELAFELLVDRFGFPKERLYATVYKGNPELNIPPDDESAAAWEKVGLRPDQIVYLGEDNFWGPAGDFGPCGPCTEVFFDTGAEYGETYVPGGDFDTTKRYIEIWNAGVFMELEKRPDGTFSPLQFHSVDTGSGLERMVMAMNGFASVYDTDLLRPLLDGVATQFKSEATSEREHRIIADHLRASTFILAEGVNPSNEGRGYIPRRLIRKCIALVTRAGVSDFDFVGLIDSIIDQFEPAYPLLRDNHNEVVEAFLEEQRQFDKVIGRGLDRLEALYTTPPFEVSGSDAFSLFATYGMPIELIRDFVSDRGGAVDEAAFREEFERHRQVSRASSQMEDVKGVHYEQALSHVSSTHFVGYEAVTAEGTVVALLHGSEAVAKVDSGDRVGLVSDTTPFYAEGGGQVGDQGTIRTADGAYFNVEDTIKISSDVYIHQGVVAEGEIRTGQTITLEIDAERRRRIRANHTATHLLHAALRAVLGSHVRQRGSLVDADRLRFDFQHPSKLTSEEICQIERLVNQSIRANLPKETSISSYDEATREGALAFFGDKYGNKVRVVRFGNTSAELCGGTHVSATGEIGLFRIASESSVASGTRRIVALTGDAAVEYTLEREQVLQSVASRFNIGIENIEDRIDSLIERAKKSEIRSPSSDAPLVDLDQGVESLPNGLQFICKRVGGDFSQMREEALRVANAIRGAACLVTKDEGKARIVVAVNHELTDRIDASEILQMLVPLVHGEGGGQKHVAYGGGDYPEGIPELIARFPEVLEQHNAVHSERPV